MIEKYFELTQEMFYIKDTFWLNAYMLINENQHVRLDVISMWDKLWYRFEFPNLKTRILTSWTK